MTRTCAVCGKLFPAHGPQKSCAGKCMRIYRLRWHKENNQRPERKAKLSALHSTPEAKAIRRMYDFNPKRMEYVKAYTARPDVKQRAAERDGLRPKRDQRSYQAIYRKLPHVKEATSRRRIEASYREKNRRNAEMWRTRKRYEKELRGIVSAVIHAIADNESGGLDMAFDMDVNRIRSMTDAELIESVVARIQSVSRNVSWLGIAIEELAKRQGVVSEVTCGLCRGTLWAYLPLVAEGKLAAQTLALFCTREMILERLVRLPILEQIALSEPGTKVTVIVADRAGGLVEQRVPPHLVPDSLVDRVFDESGRLRGADTQKMFAGVTKEIVVSGKRPATKTVRNPSVRVDPATRTVFVANRPVSLPDVVAAVVKILTANPDATKDVEPITRLVSNQTMQSTALQHRIA